MSMRWDGKPNKVASNKQKRNPTLPRALRTEKLTQILSIRHTKLLKPKSLKFKSLKTKQKTHSSSVGGRHYILMAWYLPFDLTIMMRKKWFHSMMTAWTSALVHGFEFSVSIRCCQPSHKPQTRSREIQILCYSEDHLSIRELFCLCWVFFNLFQKESSHLSQKKAFISSQLLCCWDSPITLCGAMKNCPKNDSWKKQKTPPGNISFLLAVSPEFPTGNCLQQARGCMAWGLPPPLPHPCFLKPIQSWWLSLAYKGAAASMEAHSPNPLKLTSKRGIPHSCSREGEDSGRQHKKRLLKLPTQTASQLLL